jgi:hypothetical protein
VSADDIAYLDRIASERTRNGSVPPSHTPDAFESGAVQLDAEGVWDSLPRAKRRRLEEAHSIESHDGDRSAALYAFSCKGFEEGLRAEEVFALAQTAASNKFADRPTANDDLWRDVLNAQAHVAEQQTTKDGLRFRTARELMDTPHGFWWLVQAIRAAGTHGMTAGLPKTLKSLFEMLLAVAVASGRPFLGEFIVPQARPVVYFIGEGGEGPFARRLERVAEAMGIDARELDLLTSIDIAAIDSKRFLDSLRGVLADRPGASIVIDPLYAFHGGEKDASNLFQQGALLAPVTGLCGEVEATLTIVNHFNKSGQGVGIGRITQAGGAEWVDSWTLLSHRREPDVEAGSFSLSVEVGSRQWGGRTFYLDIELGAFDDELGRHDGPLRYRVQTAMSLAAFERSSVAERVRALLGAHPFEYTRRGVETVLGERSARDALEAMIASGEAVCEVRAVADSRGRRTSRERVGLLVKAGEAR